MKKWMIGQQVWSYQIFIFEDKKKTAGAFIFKGNISKIKDDNIDILIKVKGLSKRERVSVSHSDLYDNKNSALVALANDFALNYLLKIINYIGE